ncbi:MAG: hypothetical protein ACYS0G_05210 [Planctomycetota bacterium]|jgi:hypothetical protein
MDAISQLGDSAALGLLGRVVALTVFYAALFWLPLRGMAAILRLIRRSKCRKPTHGRKSSAYRSLTVIR